MNTSKQQKQKTLSTQSENKFLIYTSSHKTNVFPRIGNEILTNCYT